MTNVKIIHKEGLAPYAGSKGAGALDLMAAIDAPITIRAGETVFIPTGVHLDMTADPTLCALVLPRSGLGSKQGLVLGNIVGLVDNDYQGEITIAAWNRNPALVQHGMGSLPGVTVTVEPGMRLAQLMFFHSATSAIVFETVKAFDVATERGEAGFGSTGTTNKKTAKV